MTGKRTKRLLSLLLSVLLVAGMLPMGAMAAELSPTSDYVDVVMKGGDVPDYTGTGSDLLTFLQGRPGYSPLAGTSMDTTGGSIAKNKEIANGLFQESAMKTDGADIVVEQGGTFWLALKLDGSHLTSGGVGCAAKSTGMSFIIAYNSGFTLLGSSATPFVMNNGIYNSGLASMITGLTPSDKSRYTISTSENVTTFPSYAADKYGKSVTVQMAPSSSLTQAYYLPAEAEWDCLMKFQVGDTMEAGKVYNFSYVEEYNTTAVSTIFVNRGPQEGTEDMLELKPSVSGPAEHIKTTNFKVKISNCSKDPAGDETAYTGAIANVKNLPYVEANSNGYVANTDTITFPAVEDAPNEGFRVGDTVIVYADEACTEELGSTKLTEGPDGNFVDGATTGTVGGRTLKLIDDDAPTTPVNKKTDGWSYIKGESEVWIKRLQPADPPKDPSSKAVRIAVTPEKLNYTADVPYPANEVAPDVKPQLKGYSEDNPIELHVGDSIGTLVTKLENAGVLNNDPALMPVSVETVDPNGETVNAKQKLCMERQKAVRRRHGKWRHDPRGHGYPGRVHSPRPFRHPQSLCGCDCEPTRRGNAWRQHCDCHAARCYL